MKFSLISDVLKFVIFGIKFFFLKNLFITSDLRNGAFGVGIVYDVFNIYGFTLCHYLWIVHKVFELKCTFEF